MLTPQADLAEASARDDRHHPRTALLRGCARTRAGEISEALADLEAVRRRHWPALDDLDRAALLAALVDCRLARGDIDQACGEGEALEPLLGAPGPTGATAHHGRGELAAAVGSPETAAAHFARVGVLALDRDDPAVLPWRAGAALSAVRLGRGAEAVALARTHLALAEQARSPYAVALGLRTLATVDGRADRIGTLRRARTTLRGTPASRLAAQIDTDLAGLLLLSADAGGAREGTAGEGTAGEGTAGEALALLRSAEAYAGREQLWPLQGRVRRLLERMGEPPRPVLAEALAALTATEQRVARLAADGLTNREIAGRLAVTVKAVEWHLSHVYRKLGIRSRAALAGSLGVA